MRIAALYDVHGNLPALEAVLREVEAEAPDLVVVGGDVAAGPQPVEVLDRLGGLAIPVRWVMGNADRGLVEAHDSGADPDQAADPVARGERWAARRLTRAHRDLLASFEPTVSAGGVLFCHGSPRSDEEMIAAVTPADVLRAMLADVVERTVVCGHTHHQFEHRIAGVHVLGAGAVGMPYDGDPAAYWLSFDPEPRHRRTDYDVEAAVARLRATGFPHVEEAFLAGSLVDPVPREEVDAFYARAAAGTD